MNVLMIVLRLIHIFSGVFWAGSGFFMVSSLAPTVKATGPEGGRFMQRLMSAGRVSQLMGLTGTLTVLSGLIMLWVVSGHFNRGWTASGYGILLIAGALAGLVAWLHGGLVIGRTGQKITELGASIQAAGGPPDAAELAELGRLQEKQFNQSAYSAIFIALALIGMSIAQYAWF